MTRLHFDELDTPIGPFAVVVDDDGRLHAAGFTAGHERMDRALRRFRDDPKVALVHTPNPGGVTGTLARYFDGDLAALDALAVAPAGTDFQRAVWEALRTIPCGATWSYADLARAIGRPTAVRAVGLANGSNPVCVVVPCHRVIGADGSLTGYGGGLTRKRWLLQHEGARAAA